MKIFYTLCLTTKIYLLMHSSLFHNIIFAVYSMPERYDLVENQTDGVGSRIPIPAFDSVSYDLVKNRLSESQAEFSSILIGWFFRFYFRLRQSSFHWIILRRRSRKRSLK